MIHSFTVKLLLPGDLVSVDWLKALFFLLPTKTIVTPVEKRKVIRNTPTRRTRRMTTQHQSVGSEESTLNSVNVSVNIDVEAEERRNELLRERVQMTRELLNMEKELSQIRNQQ